VKSIIYLAPLFLYIPRFLPSVETQPLLITGVALLGLLLGRNRRAALGFAVLALVMLFWILIKIAIDGAFGNALGLIQILIGPLTLFGALALKAPAPPRKLMAGVAIYFLLSATFEILAPDAYRAVASALLSRATVYDGHRGISLFTPEPTYATISVMYFLVLAWWSGKHWGFRYRWIEPALALCLITTGTTYAVFLLLALAFARWPRLMILGLVAVSVVVPRIGFIALDNDESIRVVVAMSRLLSADFSDFLPSISTIDSSLGSRLATNVASFLTPLHSPLGLGLNCSAVPSAYAAAGFDFAFSNVVLSAVMDEGCLKPQSYVASVALGLGALSLVFLPLLARLTIHACGRERRTLWSPPLVLAIVMLVMQVQLSSPIPWMLIYLALSGLPEHPQPRRPAEQVSHDRLAPK
jgi:hypothetical protein